MAEFEIKREDDKIVLYFGTRENSINAYTLATSLIHFADAARKANSIINPGYDIEIVVSTLTDGSFKAVVKAIYKATGSLFSAQALHAIILGVVTNAIYDLAFHKNSGVTVVVNPGEVIIEEGDKKLVVPRFVYDSTKQLQTNPEFQNSVREIVDSVKKDPAVRTFGIGHDEREVPKLNVPIEDYSFEVIDEPALSNERTIIESAQLEILKAILERSKKKWQFAWRGFKISGPVTDQEFYSKFFRHEIKIAPGDLLMVKMKVFQKKSEDAGVYTNQKYEIYEVIQHIPKIKDPGLGI